MTPTDLPFSLPGFEIDEVRNHNDFLEIFAHSIRLTAHCPTCQCSSHRIPSYDQPHPTDLPVSNQSVRLVLTVRRFRGQNEQRPRRTVVEQWPDVRGAQAQRMRRLDLAREAVALAHGGQAVNA